MNKQSHNRISTSTARRHRWGAALAACLAVLIIAGAVLLAYISSDSLWLRRRAVLHGEGDIGYIPTAAQPMDFSIRAPQAFVYDVGAGEILWQKGEERVVYPASITKLWTALCALRYLSPDDVITVGDEVSLIDPASSRAYISKGMRLSVGMLLQGMLLPSGNDAAYALAAAAGRQITPDAPDAATAVAAFVGEMNRYGKTIGLCGTVFTTPDGLAYEEHYTTVEDMILVCRMAMAHPLIAEYAAQQKAAVVYASGESITWENTNRLLDPDSPYYREGVVGLKTGSLEHNYCVIAAVEREEKTYLVGIFGAKDKNVRFADACAIIDALADADGVGRLSTTK